MYWRLLEFLEMNNCGVVLTENDKALEILDGDEVIALTNNKRIRILEVLEDSFLCLFYGKKVELKAL